MTPAFNVPEVGQYLWQIFQSAIKSISRVSEGVYSLIPPTEWESWFKLTCTIVYPREYDILVAMDRVYCEEANKELEDIRAQRDEEMKKQAKKK